MDPVKKRASVDKTRSKTIKQLNEDCDLLIKNDVNKNLVHYISSIADNTKSKTNNVSDNFSEVLDLSKMDLGNPNERFIFRSRIRAPKMFNSVSETTNLRANALISRLRPPMRKSYLDNSGKRILIDEPVQATDEKTVSVVPRSTLLSKTRQKLCKRNSAAQSHEVALKGAKVQTETCAKINVSVNAEPMDFLGLYEKATNFPMCLETGYTKEQGTQMCEHITPSELFCIEWIHKNLFEVKMNPNTLVVDDKISNLSDRVCLTRS